MFSRDELLVGHVHGHAKGRGRGALAGTRLQHVELALFDGKLHVLHVAVVLFQFFSHLLELCVNFRHLLRHFVEVHRGADARDDVFALCVYKEVTVEGLFARAGVAREAYARSGVVAGIAEDHLHHVDGRAEQAGDFLHAAIGNRLLCHPGAEHGSNGSPELVQRIIRKDFAGFLAEVFLVFADQLFPAAGGNRGVFLDS